MSKLERLNTITSILQNITVIVSLIFGGVWAYKTFVFENPAFYKVGSELYGRESEGINGNILLNLLNENERIYEVDLQLTNKSKTLSQLLNYDNVNVFYSKVGSKNKNKLSFISNIHKSEGFWIPRNQTKSLKFLLKLPEDGTFVIETNLCEKWLRDCILQKFINTEVH